MKQKKYFDCSVIQCINIKLLYLDPMYFRLYVRPTAWENYTVGSSIFRKLYLRVFDFLTFILKGFQFCKSCCCQNRIFLYFRIRGKAQHSDPPLLFIGSPSLI